MPNFLLPFKHYVAAEIEVALQHMLAGKELSRAPCGASESTLRRWRDEFIEKLREWTGQLEGRLFQLGRRVPGFISLKVSPLERLEAILSRLSPLPASWPLLVRTLWWLSTSHPL